MPYVQLTVSGAIRLVNGPSQLSGRVEIYYNGAWGTVCDDNFDSAEAAVVCRQLGFAGGTARMLADYGAGSGSILMDDLSCTGSESRLADCPSRGWGIHNCDHSEDAGVDCSEPSECPILCENNFTLFRI